MVTKKSSQSTLAPNPAKLMTTPSVIKLANQGAIEKVLEERSKHYGKFRDHAVISQGLSDLMRATPGWARLAPDQREALMMVGHKVARILNGDPDYIDSWIDISGYVTLVEQRLELQTKTKKTWRL